MGLCSPALFGEEAGMDDVVVVTEILGQEQPCCWPIAVPATSLAQSPPM